MSFADHLLITCEHGGRRVPPLYEPHFDAHRHLLDTHRGIDFGALTLAREMATALGAPLVASTTTRLLVDLNRNVRQKTLFSEATRPLPVEDRQQILRRYHRPHWRRIEAEVDGAIERGRRVVHVASHSFTPELYGEVRNADIGLLYDARRPAEAVFARRWMEAIRHHHPPLRVRRNYPYVGGSGGVCGALRRRHAPADYIGISLEVNQAFMLRGGPHWRAVRSTLIQTLEQVLREAG